MILKNMEHDLHSLEFYDSITYSHCKFYLMLLSKQSNSISPSRLTIKLEVQMKNDSTLDYLNLMAFLPAGI